MGSKENNYIERYWRDATPADAIKEPPMVARFKTDDPGPVRYIIDKLVGVIRTNAWMWRTATGGYLHCQVYDAPDPGEGWRLIDVEKESHECEKQHWHPGQKRWIDVGLSDEFYGDLIYRRRIEQPKPKYIPFTWEDREQLRGRWIQYSSKGQTVIEVCVKFTNDEDGFLINDTYNYWLLDNATFLDTGKPVGKRVD